MAFHDPRIEGHFEKRMWVCVSDDFDVPRLAREIVKAAEGNGSSDASLDFLQRSLHEKLGSKRYLLVLDDLWNEDPTKWDELRVLLSIGSQGSAVLVTTRSEKVASIVGTIEARRLDHLSEEDCWTVFKHRAFASCEDEPQSLVDIGKRIVRKFGGLPLAAKTVGSFMRHKKSEDEWLSVLQSEIWDLPAEGNKILPALRLSYDHLPSHLKECFAFCAIFPKDFSLGKDLLVQLWMANGFIPRRKKTELEAEGRRIFDELVSRCFLQNVEEVVDWRNGVKTTRCKMHDLILDLAQAVTKNECCIVDGREVEENRNATVHHVSIVRKATNTIIDKAMSGYNEGMRTLFRFNFYNGPGPHLRALQRVWLKFKSLRVLSLSGIGLKELPASVNRLKHLRYLDLSHNDDLRTLPETVTHLFHLQTLKLEGCIRLRDLPKGMKNMKNLVHLFLDGCDSLVCMPRGMENLVHLQTLSRFVVGSKTDSCGIRELKELNIRGKLELYGLGNMKSAADAKGACLSSKNNLQSLTLRWDNEPRGENVDEVMESLQPHQNIWWLEIQYYAGTSLPNWMMMCATNLTNLLWIQLYDCRKCEHLPALGQLRFLEALHLWKMDAVKDLGGTHGTFYGTGGESDVEIFPKLKMLSLWEMANLEEWLGMEVTGASSVFPQLTKLVILDCAKLTTMPHLPSVEEFTVHGCPLLLVGKQHFLQMNSLRELRIEGSSKLVTLLTGHLQSLDIRDCTSIQSLPEDMGCLTSLKELSIDSCDNLASLPDGLRCLTSLETLKITSCGSMTMLPESLGCLTRLRVLHVGSHGLASLPQSIGCLTALEDLLIEGYSKLTSLPPGLWGLTQLRSLDVMGCTELTALPEGLAGLTKLEHLGIVACHKLTSLPHGLWGLTQLRYLGVMGCTELTALPEGLEGLTKLDSLWIVDCPKLTSWPKSLQPQLPKLESLIIKGCPVLERRCEAGGEYWHLVADIPIREIRR